MITLVLPYFCNGGMLDKHFSEWASYGPHVKENIRVIIVDDGSPRDPAANHMRDVGMDVQLYAIKQNLVWNVAGARNLGMHVATGDGWYLLTDIDHLLESRQAAELLWVDFTDVPHRDKFYCTFERKWADGRPLHPHPNTYLLKRKLYWDCGGTDEDFSGYWGAGEQCFRKALAANGFHRHISSVYLTHFGRDDIPDASTTDWGRRGSEYDWRNNPKLVEKAKRAPYKPERPLRFEWEKVL